MIVKTTFTEPGIRYYPPPVKFYKSMIYKQLSSFFSVFTGAKLGKISFGNGKKDLFFSFVPVKTPWATHPNSTNRIPSLGLGHRDFRNNLDGFQYFVDGLVVGEAGGELL